MHSPALWYWYVAGKGLDPNKASELMGKCFPRETITQAEAAINSWKPSEGEMIKSDARVLRVTEESIKTLLYYKWTVLPPKLLKAVGVEELKKKIGNFKIVRSLPADFQDHLPKEFKGIQE